jgi:hypothetical protein
MQGKTRSGNPILRPFSLLLITALLVVSLAGSALAGTGTSMPGNNNGKNKGAAHGKCKKGKSKGKAKSSVGKRCHKRKPKQGPSTPPVVTPPSTPPATPPSTPPTTPPVTPPATTTLAVDQSSVDFGAAQHGGFGACQADPDPDCPTRVITVTNIGGAASGVPTASIVETRNPEGMPTAAFQVVANTCTAALAPGASCAITVKFAPQSNAGDEIFASRLDVSASPGSAVSAVLNGEAR